MKQGFGTKEKRVRIEELLKAAEVFSQVRRRTCFVWVSDAQEAETQGLASSFYLGVKGDIPSFNEWGGMWITHVVLYRRGKIKIIAWEEADDAKISPHWGRHHYD